MSSSVRVMLPVPAMQVSIDETAQQVLRTDMTNIVMSQWEVEDHKDADDDVGYVAFCSVNRRLDPLPKPVFLHIKAKDFAHLQELFQSVEWLA